MNGNCISGSFRLNLLYLIATEAALEFGSGLEARCSRIKEAVGKRLVRDDLADAHLRKQRRQRLVVGIVTGALMFGEAVDARILIGTGLILGGVALVGSKFGERRIWSRRRVGAETKGEPAS